MKWIDKNSGLLTLISLIVGIISIWITSYNVNRNIYIIVASIVIAIMLILSLVWIYKILKFLNECGHCSVFCVSQKREVPLDKSKKITLLKTRNYIIERVLTMINSSDKSDEILYIVNKLDEIHDAKLLDILTEKVAEGFALRIIYNGTSSKKWQYFLDNLKDNAKKINTDGIRMLLVKNKSCFFCNSKSIDTDFSMENEYIAYYSEEKVDLKMLEILFNNYWN